MSARTRSAYIQETRMHASTNRMTPLTVVDDYPNMIPKYRIMYTFGLDEQAVRATFKWTLRIGMTAAIALASFGAFSFFKATWLIMFPHHGWDDARVQNLLLASGFHFGAGLYLYKNMWSLIQALHAVPPGANPGAMLILNTNQDKID